MRKIKLSTYAKRLTEDKNSESFSFNIYNGLFTILKDDDDHEYIKKSTKLMMPSNKIDMIP